MQSSLVAFGIVWPRFLAAARPRMATVKTLRKVTELHMVNVCKLAQNFIIAANQSNNFIIIIIIERTILTISHKF